MAERKIKITDQHILCGDRFSCSNCPLALAIDEELKPGYSVQVGPWSAWVMNDDGDQAHRFDHGSEKWIAEFDDGQDPAPTTVTLRCDGPMPDIWKDDVGPAESE